MNNWQVFIVCYMATPWLIILSASVWLVSMGIEPIKRTETRTWWKRTAKLCLWPWYLPAALIKAGIDIGKRER